MRTTIAQTDRWNELQAIVAQLGTTLAASERRTARLERIIRWGALAGLGALMITLLTVFKPMGNAVAAPETNSLQMFSQALDQVEPGMGQNSSMVRFIDDLAALVHNLRVVTDESGGMLRAAWGDAVMLAQNESKYVAERVHTCEDLTNPENRIVNELRVHKPLGVFSLRYFCDPHRPDPSGSGGNAPIHQPPVVAAEFPTDYYMRPLLKAGSNILVDMGVLMTRVRQDSNAFRKWLVEGGNEQVLAQISGELHFLNASIAAMVREMSVMSYSMGSTAGRMGSWMPW